MTLTISTNLGSIKVIPSFKLSSKLKRKIEGSLRLAVEQGDPVDRLLDKIEKNIPWANTSRGNLIAYMTGQSYSQKRLSKEADIPQGHLSQMIHGKRPIGPTIAKKLGRVFGVDYHRFL